MELNISDWTSFKNLCVTTKGLNCQYVTNLGSYTIIGPDSNNINWVLELPFGNLSDCADFATNYRALFNGKISIAQLDSDGAILSRTKVSPTGWNFNYRMFEVQLATAGGLINNDQDGKSVGDATITLYDINGIVTTVTANAVKTVVDIEPPYDICVVGGCLRMDIQPISDVFLNVIAVPDVPYAYGGSKVFVQNANLSYISSSIGLDADGRASKLLKYSSTLHTNKFRFQFAHVAGYQFWCAILMEIYKQ